MHLVCYNYVVIFVCPLVSNANDVNKNINFRTLHVNVDLFIGNLSDAYEIARRPTVVLNNWCSTVAIPIEL